MRLHFGVVLLAAVIAKGEACSTEYQPGTDGGIPGSDAGADGAAVDDFAVLPTAVGEEKPMTCEWLDGDNCWKQFVQEALACAPKEAGQFAAGRGSCSFPNGSVLELAGPISEPVENSTSIVVVNHRLQQSSGEVCQAARLLSESRTALRGGDKIAVFQAKSLTAARLICPDGSVYSNDAVGTCPDFGTRWLQGRTPGYLLSCQGSSNQCKTEFRGGAVGGNPAPGLVCND